MNLDEWFFCPLTCKRLRPGLPHAVHDLERSSSGYIAAYNENPGPPVWTKSTGEMSEKVERARQSSAASYRRLR